MDMDRFDWLANGIEPAIDADRRIVDPHHHLWHGGGRIADYLAADLLVDLTGSHNVVKTVFVDCKANYDHERPRHMKPVGETQFVAQQAAATDAAGGPTIAATVSHADMMRGEDAAEVLEAHIEADTQRFRGIRHATAWDELLPHGHSRLEPEMMATPEFHAGVRTLGTMGLSFDAWLYHTQLHELEALAQDASETSIILDHIGGPLGLGHYGEARDDHRQAWRQSMTAVAALPNVALKVGGIGMDNYYGTGLASLPEPANSQQIADYWSDDLRFCIDLFGPSRCMFESNFPVDRQSVTYSALWNAFQIIADGYDESEQVDLFAGTAERVYRLNG